MSQFDRAVSELNSAERDGISATTICLLKAVEMLNRHHVTTNDPVYFKIASLASILNASLLNEEGAFNLIQRMRRMEKTLDDAFQAADTDS